MAYCVCVARSASVRVAYEILRQNLVIRYSRVINVRESSSSNSCGYSLLLEKVLLIRNYRDNHLRVFFLLHYIISKSLASYYR